MYCPACRSLLFPIDTAYIEKYGICSYCVTFGKAISKVVKAWENNLEYHVTTVSDLNEKITIKEVD